MRKREELTGELNLSKSLLNRSEQDLLKTTNLRELNHQFQFKVGQLESEGSSKAKKLEAKLAALSREQESLKSTIAEQVNVIKIKDSMLDDQNESLKTLKINLENKNRDHQSVLHELESYRDAYEELAEKDTKELEAEVIH